MESREADLVASKLAEMAKFHDGHIKSIEKIVDAELAYANAKIDRLQAELASVKAALEKYGKHISDGLHSIATDGACPAIFIDESTMKPGKCICGLDEVLKSKAS